MCVSDNFIICGTYEKLIHVWDKETMTPVQTLEGASGGGLDQRPLGDPRFLPLERLPLARPCLRLPLTFFDNLRAPGHTGTIYGLAVVTDGQGCGRLFSASYDRTIRVRPTLPRSRAPCGLRRTSRRMAPLSHPHLPPLPLL